jgi:hypothetical protein
MIEDNFDENIQMDIPENFQKTCVNAQENNQVETAIELRELINEISVGITNELEKERNPSLWYLLFINVKKI